MQKGFLAVFALLALFSVATASNIYVSCLQADDGAYVVSASFDMADNKYHWAGVYSRLDSTLCGSNLINDVDFGLSTSGKQTMYLAGPHSNSETYVVGFFETDSFVQPGSRGSCNYMSSSFVTCYPKSARPATGLTIFGIICIVILVLLGLGFCVTIVLIIIRRNKERQYELMKNSQTTHDDNSIVDLSDRSVDPTQSNVTMAPMPAIPQMMMSNPYGNGAYMAAPPVMYYMPADANGAPMYVATNAGMMMSQPQPVFIATNPQQRQ